MLTIGPGTPSARLCFYELLVMAILAHTKKYESFYLIELPPKKSEGWGFLGRGGENLVLIPSALGRDESQINTYSTEFGAGERPAGLYKCA